MKPTSDRSRKGKRPAAPVPPPADRSRWAYFMNGINPDTDDAAEVERVTAAFGRTHPAWLIASNPARKATGEAFRGLRQYVLGLSRGQVAAYLRVSVRTVAAWETDASAVPFSAFEALRLLSESTAFRLSHDAWEGWFINRQSGELVSPDVGRLAVRPEEINAIPQLHSELYRHQSEALRLRRELEEAQAENTRLRTLFLADGVTDELRDMQDRLNGLLARVATARIVEFPAAPETSHSQRKVAAL